MFSFHFIKGRGSVGLIAYFTPDNKISSIKCEKRTHPFRVLGSIYTSEGHDEGVRWGVLRIDLGLSVPRVSKRGIR